MEWVLGILVALIVAILVMAAVQRPQKKKNADIRRRYAIDATNAARIPLAPEPGVPAAAASTGVELSFERGEQAVRTIADTTLDRSLDEARPLFGDNEPLARVKAVTGRVVQTADGEQILTTPPFALRPQMVSTRLGRFVNGLSKRLPPWVVVCPRVRLEALVTPTAPDGRDASDWSQWRRRVRLRAVDVVLCDRRTWKPLLAIMLRPSSRFGSKAGTSGTVHALTLGGGQDRMVDEVLAHAGLTLIHASGKIADDWALIEPYVDQAILTAPGDDDAAFASHLEPGRPDPDAAVRLLRMDGGSGWLLE